MACRAGFISDVEAVPSALIYPNQPRRRRIGTPAERESAQERGPSPGLSRAERDAQSARRAQALAGAKAGAKAEGRAASVCETHAERRPTNSVSQAPHKSSCRNPTIPPNPVNSSIALSAGLCTIHNGTKFVSVRLTQDMVGHKLGESSFGRRAKTPRGSGSGSGSRSARQT